MVGNTRDDERRARLKQLAEETRRLIATSDIEAEDEAIAATSRRLAIRLKQSKGVDAKMFKVPITV